MFRKLAVIAVAIAMPVGVIAATGGIAGATTTGAAAKDSIVCKDITGTLKFSRALNNTGYTSGTIVTTVTAYVTGCTTAGPYHVSVTRGTVTGTLTGATGTVASPTGKCTGLLGSAKEVGTLTTTWSATPGILASKSAIKSDAGGAHSGYGTFTLPGSTPSGPPTGSFGGANASGSADKSTAQTALKIGTATTSGTILYDCGHGGITSLKIDTDSAAAAISLND